ncbi:hypothetical protein MNBD_GAMMA17-834 [hydrothermal vent metagenome]|uniref:DUF2946 domain-containing protein n=1 Tax=hydrothermal vent metagenome TaxID=652676 RepID=A0A3B0ZR33_9ZZZZ
MKKILICLLLLANLSAGLAFAWDSHPEAMVGHDSTAIELLAGSDHDHLDGDLHHNDHCCHGAAHLVGLIFSQSTPFVASSHDGFIALSQAPARLYIAPLLRPPIV